MTAEIRPLRWVDRSRIVTDWSCPRRRFWQYEYEGKGITPATTGLELFLGTTIHDALARIADAQVVRDARQSASDRFPPGIDDIASEAQRAVYDTLSAVQPGEIPDAETRTFAAEQAALIEGLIRGFFRHTWPRLLREGWRIVAVEQEVVYRISDTIRFMSKPDLILEDPEGNWWYVEYKSTSTKKGSWIDSWATAVQLHSGCKAVEETLGKPVTGVIVQGLYKGYESYGRQNSPFCYAYVRAGNPPFTADQIQYEYRAGFRRQPVWELPGGVARWVADMPEAILADQFPQAPPIFVRDELVYDFFAQVKERETIIAASMERIGRSKGDGDPNVDAEMAYAFPQHFDQCTPAWGRGCSYKRLCHGRVEAPLEQGFAWREPHHQPELDALGGGDG